MDRRRLVGALGSYFRLLADPGATKNTLEEILWKFTSNKIDEKVFSLISRSPTPLKSKSHQFFSVFFVVEKLMVGALGFEPRASTSRTWRATKLRYAPTESS